ncbi:MAG: hypothetical protein HYY68_08825 [Thaumarchaeota archaeon]|nr:hypothetical protein [Nitrososphaerota archaeon]
MKDLTNAVGTRRKADLHLEMIRLFCELGPFAHTEIARRLSVSSDSVTRYYNRLLQGRIRFKPNVNRWALGLRRVIVRITFFPEFEPHGKDICVGLAKLAYVAYFSRLMPENEWVLHFQVPFKHQGRLWEFLTKLEELQVLKLKEVYQTDIRIGAPFRAEYFDPEAVKFKFDWSSIKPSYVPDPSQEYEEKVTFDATDLRIIEQLQIEPLKLAEVARKAELDKWTTYWHWKKHVSRIIKGWYVDWLGTWIVDQDDKIAMSRREFVVFSLFAKSLFPGELKVLREKLNSLPYLWSEQIGKGGDNVLQIIIPNESLVELYAYFGKLDETIKSKIILRVEDQGRAINFSVPPEMYDDREGWTFDYEDVLARFRNMALEVRLRAVGNN